MAKDKQQREFDKAWSEYGALRETVSKHAAEYWYFRGRRDEFITRSDNEEATGSMYHDKRLKHEVCRWCDKAINKTGKHGAFIHVRTKLRTCRNGNGIHKAAKVRMQ